MAIRKGQQNTTDNQKKNTKKETKQEDKITPRHAGIANQREGERERTRDS